MLFRSGTCPNRVLISAMRFISNSCVLLLLSIFVLCATRAEATQPATPHVLYPSSQRVVLFVAEGCSYCREAAQYLAAHGIACEIRDIRKQHRWYREWRDHLQGDIVPLIVLDNGRRIIDGFDPKTLTRVLQSTGIMPKTDRNP